MQIYRNITNIPLKRIKDTVSTYESAGYSGLLTTELKHDPFLPLGIAAVHTRKINLATGIAAVSYTHLTLPTKNEV